MPHDKNDEKIHVFNTLAFHITIPCIKQKYEHDEAVGC